MYIIHKFIQQWQMQRATRDAHGFNFLRFHAALFRKAGHNIRLVLSPLGLAPSLAWRILDLPLFRIQTFYFRGFSFTIHFGQGHGYFVYPVIVEMDNFSRM